VKPRQPERHHLPRESEQQEAGGIAGRRSMLLVLVELFAFSFRDVGISPCKQEHVQSASTDSPASEG